jgi:hypothetical protein
VVTLNQRFEGSFIAFYEKKAEAIRQGLVKENVVKIGVRSALLSRSLKKGFSSVVYIISTLAVGSIFRDKKKLVFDRPFCRVAFKKIFQV